MSNCNLRGVSFQGVGINGVNFNNSDLSGALWVDGRICSEGSIGSCL